MELYKVFFAFYRDSSKDGEETAEYVFRQVFQDAKTKDCKIWLILCSEQDEADAASVDEIKSILELKSSKNTEDKEIHIAGCSTKDGTRINEDIDWIVHTHKENTGR